MATVKSGVTVVILFIVTEICKANYDEWIKNYTADDTEGLFNFVIMNDYKYELEEY